MTNRYAPFFCNLGPPGRRQWSIGFIGDGRDEQLWLAGVFRAEDVP
jgi:hypothetical protein